MRLLLLAALAAPAIAGAQELEPRAYSPSPVGTNFLVVALQRTDGAILFDAASPITNASATVDAAIVGGGHVFGLFGRQASLSVAAPYARGTASGDVGDARRTVDRAGPGDARIRLAALLVGGPALDRAAFAGRRRGPIVGTSLTIVAPTGQYAGDRLVNVGTNRWAFKPEVGVSLPQDRWQFDAYAGAWFFDSNDDFYTGGRRRTQEPLYAYQGHVSYTFRPGLWVAANATYFQGGRTTVDGVRGDDRQRNSRVGLTLSVPLAPQHSVKLAWTDGAVTRVGGDFQTFSVAWQHAWSR